MLKKVGAILALIAGIGYFVLSYLISNTTVLAASTLPIDIIIIILACITLAGLIVIGSTAVPLWIIGVVIWYVSIKNLIPVDETINGYILIAGLVFIVIALVFAIIDIFKTIFKRKKPPVVKYVEVIKEEPKTTEPEPVKTESTENK